MAEQMGYEDPHTPLHPPKKPLDSLLKIFQAREKKIPKSGVPLTKRNVEEFFDPSTYSDIDDAFIRPSLRNRGKISVQEWLQLLP